ncbi:MAG: hypothetical protein Q4G50_09630 [Corynebacterium sp.]|uniref:hypothetical protein n=1 Tax=Corynebacterium sp. TaxID=1720 RepID=UPI0026DFB99C|nr:hypothetical protein [Corynebacterium sp.]MDO5670252.1 hypothetical protein [Corynebacterium sp.]
MTNPEHDGENINAFRMTTNDREEPASESMQDVAEQAVERADEEQEPGGPVQDEP